MSTEGLPRIVAVVTTDANAVAGGVPVFYAKTKDERDQIAEYLVRPLRAVAHDIGNGSYVIVQHG